MYKKNPKELRTGTNLSNKRIPDIVRLVVLFLLFAGVNPGTISQVADSVGYIVRIGEQAPDFEFEYANGEKARLSDYSGKIVMLQFTASWCKVCREEMPHIEKEIWNNYKDKGLVLIGIDRDEPGDKVNAFAGKMKITYPLALDPGAGIFSLYALKESGVTRNVIIDRNGQIAFLTRLYKPDEFQKMVRVIDKLINQP